MPRPLLCPVPQNCVGCPQPVFQGEALREQASRACNRDWCTLSACLLPLGDVGTACAAPGATQCAAAACQRLSRGVCKCQPGFRVCSVRGVRPVYGAVRNAFPPTPWITCGQSEPTITETCSLQGLLTFPSRLAMFAPGVEARVLWPSRVVCVSGWCAWCQKRSPMLAFDAQGGWTGRCHLVVCLLAEPQSGGV